MLNRTLTCSLYLSLAGCLDTSQLLVWEGYLYTQTEDGLVAMPNAFTELYGSDGTLLIEGTVPVGRPSNFNQISLEDEWIGQVANLRVGGEGNQTVQWAGRIPNKASTWIPGTLFGVNPEYLMTFLRSFAEPAEVTLENDGIHLWGEPLEPTSWVDSTITLKDSDGTDYPIYQYSQLDTGLISTNISEKVDWFFAWNLPKRTLTLTVTTPDGQVIDTTYYPQQGDVLSALYYALPLQEDE